MKPVLLMAAFIALAAFVGKLEKPNITERKSTHVYYSVPGAKSRSAIKVFEEEVSGQFVIQFENLAELWLSTPASQSLGEVGALGTQVISSDLALKANNVRFVASPTACRFLPTTPRTFNCDNDKINDVIATTRVGGVDVHLVSLTSGVYEGAFFGTDGKIKEDKKYAVKVGIRFGAGNFYVFTTMTNPNLIDTSPGFDRQRYLASK